MPGGNVIDRVELGGMPGVVDRENSLCSSSDGSFDLSRIQIQRIRLDVRKAGPSAQMLDDIGAGAKRHGRGDHFVAGANPKSQEPDVKACGTRVQAQRIRSLD